jgi:hypothetical protein
MKQLIGLYILSALIFRLFFLVAFDAYPFESLSVMQFEEINSFEQEYEIAFLYLKGLLGELIFFAACAIPAHPLVRLLIPLLDLWEKYIAKLSSSLEQLKREAQELKTRYQNWKYK